MVVIAVDVDSVGFEIGEESAGGGGLSGEIMDVGSGWCVGSGWFVGSGWCVVSGWCVGSGCCVGSGWCVGSDWCVGLDSGGVRSVGWVVWEVFMGWV